jgi:hypothetical protein
LIMHPSQNDCELPNDWIIRTMNEDQLEAETSRMMEDEVIMHLAQNDCEFPNYWIIRTLNEDELEDETSRTMEDEMILQPAQNDCELPKNVFGDDPAESLQPALNYTILTNDICRLLSRLMNGHLPLSFLMVLITLTLVLLRWMHLRLPSLVQPSSLLIIPDGEQVHQYTDSIPPSIMKIPGQICRVCLQKWAVSVGVD